MSVSQEVLDLRSAWDSFKQELDADLLILMNQISELHATITGLQNSAEKPSEDLDAIIALALDIKSNMTTLHGKVQPSN